MLTRRTHTCGSLRESHIGADVIVQGWASAGHGKLKGSGATVDWRWVTLDIKGQSIIVCLYAESAQAARYNETFNRILRSIAPLDSAPPA